MTSTLKIATWNVNSIKSRLEHAIDYLREELPDILLLQELKCITENFPREPIEDLGYNLAIHGQKTYNGVAILSKHPIDETITELPGDKEDLAARYIESVISLEGQALRIASVYVPNGQSPDSDKFQYKLAFFDRLRNHIESLLPLEEIFIIGGDFNVAPDNIDVYNPAQLEGTTCFHPQERAKYRALLGLGLTDAYRSCHPEQQQFSWWDYRGGSWQQGKGMRIDHLLLSPQAADCCTTAGVDETPRNKEKPSDHTPVWCGLELEQGGK